MQATTPTKADQVRALRESNAKAVNATKPTPLSALAAKLDTSISPNGLPMFLDRKENGIKPQPPAPPKTTARPAVQVTSVPTSATVAAVGTGGALGGTANPPAAPVQAKGAEAPSKPGKGKSTPAGKPAGLLLGLLAGLAGPLPAGKPAPAKPAKAGKPTSAPAKAGKAGKSADDGKRSKYLPEGVAQPRGAFSAEATDRAFDLIGRASGALSTEIQKANKWNAKRVARFVRTMAPLCKLKVTTEGEGQDTRFKVKK